MSGVSSDFDYQQVTDSMGQSTQNLQNKLSSFSQSMDSTNAADMVKLENLTNQWSLAVNLQSSMIKTIGDALKGVVQKIN